MMRLSDEYSRFCDLLALGEEYFTAGNFPAAVGVAQIAARYAAFPGNVGLFASPRLERLLLELGKQIRAASACSIRHSDGNSRNNILHILTYGRPLGGDSRFVWRWIQEDRSSRHSIAITTQADVIGTFGIPEILRQSAEDSGGFLRTLSAPTSKPLEQACELRTLCQEADIVVLHLFQHDIIPVLALAADCDSVKTVFINHADHTFWIGASVAHCVAHLRRQSSDFLRTRRRLEPCRSSTLPIPLACSHPPLTRAQAKGALGYEPDVVLLLTIASPYKYISPGQVSFLDLVVPVIANLPQAVLIAVGPEPEGIWQSASIRTNGRIVPLGTRVDNDLLYMAADVYLDSIPFSSITSLLEAGSRGVPLLGYNQPNPELMLLGPGAPGLDNTMELANDQESYQILLTRLIGDAEFRRRCGERVQRQILSLHTGSNWIRVVHDLYAKVGQSNDRGCFVEDNDIFDPNALDLAIVQLGGRQDRMRVRRLIAKYVGALPYRSRLSTTWHLHLKGFDLCLVNLLPPPVNVITLGIGRWLKSIIRRFSTDLMRRTS